MMRLHTINLMLQATKWIRWFAIICIVFFLWAAIDHLVWLKRVPICPLEEHPFNGKNYDIEFCVLGGGDYHEYMHLRVFNKSGELLAARGSTFHKEGRLNYMAIMSDQIRYSDDPMDQINPPLDCVLAMPPTKIDWWEARLPGGLPGVNHCQNLKFEDRADAMNIWEQQEAKRQKKREEKAKAE